MDEMLVSAEDPFVWDIARIRREGELDALRYAIRMKMDYFKEKAWGDTDRGPSYKNLGVAIARAEHKLKEMRMLLDEMVNIDPSNS